MIENPRSGERVEFVSETSEALTMLTTWTRPGHRAAEHIHPNMEERFEVLEGRAAFRVDGIEIVAAAGEIVIAVIRLGNQHELSGPCRRRTWRCRSVRVVQLGVSLRSPVAAMRNTRYGGRTTSALYSWRSCIGSSPWKNRRVNSAQRKPGRISIFRRTGASVGFQAR